MTPVTKMRDRLGAELFRRVAGPDGPQHRERIHGTPGPRWFPAGQPDRPGARRRVDVRRRHPGGPAADAAPGGDDGGGRALRLPRRHVGPARPHQPLPRGHHLRHRGRRPAGRRRRSAPSTTGCIGTMPDGTPYAASDPHLLRWVHVAEVDSFLLAHQVYGKRAARPGRPRRVRRPDGRASRGKLGVVDPPTTEAELTAAVEAFRPELAATEHAREAVSFLVWHPPLPWAARPGVRRAGGGRDRADAASGRAGRSGCRGCRSVSAPSCAPSAAPRPEPSAGRCSRRRRPILRTPRRRRRARRPARCASRAPRDRTGDAARCRPRAAP